MFLLPSALHRRGLCTVASTFCRNRPRGIPTILIHSEREIRWGFIRFSYSDHKKADFALKCWVETPSKKINSEIDKKAIAGRTVHCSGLLAQFIYLVTISLQVWFFLVRYKPHCMATKSRHQIISESKKSWWYFWRDKSIITTYHLLNSKAIFLCISGSKAKSNWYTCVNGFCLAKASRVKQWVKAIKVLSENKKTEWIYQSSCILYIKV